MSLLARASQFYDAAVVPPQRVHVDDAAAYHFSRAVKAILRDVEEEASPAWESLLTAGRAARWRATVDPTPFGSSLSTITQPLAQVIELGHRFEGHLAQHQELLIRELIAAAFAYQDGRNAAFSTTILDCLTDGNPVETCLVVQSRRIALAAQAWLSAEGLPVPVLVPREYLAGRVWDFAVVAGAGWCFPPQMLTSPRAWQVTLIHHHWIKDNQDVWGVFGERATSPIKVTVQEPAAPAQNWQPWSGMDVADLHLAPDWSAVFSSAPRPLAEETETVPARLALLGGGYAVWLRTEGERIRGLDPEAPPGKRVQNLPLPRVAPGSVLVLRPEVSEAATTRSVAYGILGNEGQRIRRLQDEWKSLLRDILVRDGITETCKRLLDRRASTANVVYWAHEDSVRPRKDDDFRILLRMLGISETEQHIEAGRTLWRACTSAGRRLAEALEQKAESVDLSQLELNGIQELHLDKVPGAATMTAFRVLGISSETAEVSQRDTRRPFSVKGAEWLE